jgi:hypothetical protein
VVVEQPESGQLLELETDRHLSDGRRTEVDDQGQAVPPFPEP